MGMEWENRWSFHHYCGNLLFKTNSSKDNVSMYIHMCMYIYIYINKHTCNVMDIYSIQTSMAIAAIIWSDCKRDFLRKAQCKPSDRTMGISQGGLVNLCSGVLVWHPDVAEGDESWFRTHDFMELIHGLRRDKSDLWT